ncbi:hypothetical protein [Leclercia sp. AS011]|jgi:hypothetical protein|uniref:hypothetical protein n=1 Tax=Leclercia sp. AS011 TaxID=3081257 RepID=UPI00301B40CF
MTFEHTRHYFLEPWAFPQTRRDNAALTGYDQQLKLVLLQSGFAPLLEMNNALNSH